MKAAGWLHEGLMAAWDYDFVLRLWKQGGAICIKDKMPIADFRWHEGSISGRGFFTQFKEEVEIARKDAGLLAPQTLIHHGVRWGIVGIYALMAACRDLRARNT